MITNRIRRNWRVSDIAHLLACVAIGVWLVRAPLADVFALAAADAEQSHVFLAPLVAGYLLWLRRSRLRFVCVNPSIAGAAIAVAGWLICSWGFHSGTQIAWHAGAMISVIGIVLSMTGLVPLRLFAPVFVMLLFMLPVPGEIRHAIAHPLQEMASRITHATLELMGVSSVRSGNVLIINGEHVAVGEACNGMRMVFALTLVVYAFAFSTALRPGTRLFLVALSPVIAMACNVIRLVPTSLMFGYSSSEIAYQFHEISGWVMLPLALLALALILRTIRWLDFPVMRLRLATQ